MKITPFEHCQCKKTANQHELCVNHNTFSEQGKQVTFTSYHNETLVSLVLDGCVFTDNKPKCDGLFLFSSRNRKHAVLIELKGSGELPKAFSQLAYVRQQRPEYRSFLSSLNELPGPKAQESAFIISNGMMSKPEKEALENQHRIRVKEILHCEATSPIPDIRKYI